VFRLVIRHTASSQLVTTINSRYDFTHFAIHYSTRFSLPRYLHQSSSNGFQRQMFPFFLLGSRTILLLQPQQFSVNELFNNYILYTLLKRAVSSQIPLCPTNLPSYEYNFTSRTAQKQRSLLLLHWEHAGNIFPLF
jgi:hypothetical protein